MLEITPQFESMDTSN